MNLHSCFVLSFLILEGEMFVVLCGGSCYVVAVIQAWRIPCLLFWNGVFSSFCFHFLGALG